MRASPRESDGPFGDPWHPYCRSMKEQSAFYKPRFRCKLPEYWAKSEANVRYRCDRPSTPGALATGRSNVLQPAGSRGWHLQIGSYRAHRRDDPQRCSGHRCRYRLDESGLSGPDDHVPSRERDPPNRSAAAGSPSRGHLLHRRCRVRRHSARGGLSRSPASGGRCSSRSPVWRGSASSRPSSSSRWSNNPTAGT